MFGLRGRAARTRVNRSQRRCRFESLEQRIALSGTPPTVVGVEVSSSQWAASYFSFLQTHNLGNNGYAIPVGSSAQAATLAWKNLDQIIVEFSEDVDIQSADLSVSGKNSTSYAINDFFYDPQTRLATWTLAAPIAKDRLMIDLDADGIDPVVDLDGNVLDGEWTNNSDTFASGNGTAGGDFEFLFNVLPGDINSTGQVTNLDYMLTRSHEGKTTAGTGYSPKYDIDGSGVIEISDWQFVLSKLAHSLPTGDPAGKYNDAPTTQGFDLVYIDDDAVDVAISMWGGFSDAENGASGLSYSVKTNSNPSLFDHVSINSQTGELNVSAAPAASGRAKITISATDSGGITTDSTVDVDVDYVNQPPQIIYPLAEYLGAYTWKITGTVADDEDVTDLLVTFRNVFDARAAVYPDGTFELAIILEDEPYGWEEAFTFDRQGLQSNIVSFVIGFY